MTPNKMLFVCCYIVAAIKSGSADGLENFVRVKLANYSNWLETEDLDPSPALHSIPIHISDATTNLDFILTDFSVQGHSGRIEFEILETDLTKGIFRATLNKRGNITFFGQYRANGTLLSSVPVATQGYWNVRVANIHSLWFDIYFPITEPAGFLNVTDYQLFITILNGEYDLYFENLWEDEAVVGYEEVIKKSVFRGFQFFMENPKFNSAPVEDPIRALYLRYWEEVLRETTLADIIDATIPIP